MNRSAFVRLVVVFAALAGCEDAPPGRDAPRAPPTAVTARGGETLPSASASSLAPPPSASVAAPPTASGAWEGKYDAKKGEIALPPKVPDKTWKKDDGKVASGAGSMTLTIDGSGGVTGKSTGALGELDVTGRVEGAIVRASVMPRDPAAPPSMTGVLVGMLEGDVIRAELKAAGPDASIVRESKIELRRKP